MKKRVNAGIKSPAELAQRLYDGEVFWCGESLISYSKDHEERGANPFRCGPNQLKAYWSNFDEMEIEAEVEWWEECSPENPVWCWFWDGLSQQRIPGICAGFDGEHYKRAFKIADSGDIISSTYFSNAEIMTKEDVMKYIWSGEYVE